MPPPSISAISQRLTSLSALVLERSRVVSLSLPPSASTDAQIIRGLTFVRDGLAQLADEIRLESKGLSVGMSSPSTATATAAAAAAKEDEVQELARRYDRLIEIMEQDDLGRQKVSSLKKLVAL